MKVGLENQRVNNSITHRYINYFKTQNNVLLQNELNKELEHNYVEFQRIYLGQAKFNGAFNFFEGIAHNFIYLLLIMIGCYLIVEYQNINIGQLTFLISLISMISGAFNGLCEFITKRIEYVQMSEIYKNFIMLGNRKTSQRLPLTKVKEISINNKVLISGKEYEREIIKTLLLEENVDKFYINETKVSNFEQQNYFEQLFMISYDTKFEPNWIYQNFEQDNTIFLKTVQKFGINLAVQDAPNIYEQTLLNVLTCMLVKDKTIVFNDCFKYVTKENLI
jgi:ABC-type multidrug transport system fused ATPase/permease subunit